LRRIAFLSVLVLTLTVAMASPEGVSLQPPQLVVERTDGLSRIWVEIHTADGATSRALVRETAGTVAAGPAGTDPAGAAVFARWSEEGRTWSTFSRDGGRAWSEPRITALDLRLHAGAVLPGQPMPTAPEGLRLPADGNVFLVQLKAQSLPEFRSALEGAGARILRYFPNNAHLVRLDPSRLAAVSGLEFVERIEPFHPFYRIQRELLDWLASPEPRAEAME